MRAAAVLAVATALSLTACGGDRSASTEPQRPIVLVSGRDDHGLVAKPELALTRVPDGPATARVRDGTLVYVLGSRGEWLQVRTIEGAVVRGWINDFYLRGTTHLIARRAGCPVPSSDRPGGLASGSFTPNAQVEMLDLRRIGTTTWLLVRDVKGGRRGWVERQRVAELPRHGHC